MDWTQTACAVLPGGECIELPHAEASWLLFGDDASTEAPLAAAIETAALDDVRLRFQEAAGLPANARASRLAGREVRGAVAVLRFASGEPADLSVEDVDRWAPAAEGDAASADSGSGAASADEPAAGVACSQCGAPEPAPGQFKQCARCHKVQYCSRDCQKAHWKGGHKRECSA